MAQKRFSGPESHIKQYKLSQAKLVFLHQGTGERRHDI